MPSTGIMIAGAAGAAIAIPSHGGAVGARHSCLLPAFPGSRVVPCLLRCRLDRGLAHPEAVAVAHQCKVPAMECEQCRSMADRHDRRAVEPLVKEAVKRGLGRLIERGRRLVEEKIVRCLQDGAGDAEALLLAER